MVCIEIRPHILYGRSSALHFRYLTCLLDRGHIKTTLNGFLYKYKLVANKPSLKGKVAGVSLTEGLHLLPYGEGGEPTAKRMRGISVASD